MLDKIFQFNKSNYNKVYSFFILKLLAIYFLWDYLLRTIIYKFSFNDTINSTIASNAAYLLRLVGYDTFNKGGVVFWDNEVCVSIGTPCNGISFMGIVTALTFSTPTKLKNKLLFLPFIITCIYISNAIRVAMLAYTWKFNYLAFEFNHKTLYLYTIYALIFVIWYLWFQRVSLSIEKKSE